MLGQSTCQFTVWEAFALLCCCICCLILSALTDIGINTNPEQRFPTFDWVADLKEPAKLIKVKKPFMSIRDAMFNFANGIVPAGIVIVATQLFLRKRTFSLNGGECVWAIQGLIQIAYFTVQLTRLCLSKRATGFEFWEAYFVSQILFIAPSLFFLYRGMRTTPLHGYSWMNNVGASISIFWFLMGAASFPIYI